MPENKKFRILLSVVSWKRLIPTKCSKGVLPSIPETCWFGSPQNSAYRNCHSHFEMLLLRHSLAKLFHNHHMSWRTVSPPAATRNALGNTQAFYYAHASCLVVQHLSSFQCQPWFPWGGAWCFKWLQSYLMGKF